MTQKKQKVVPHACMGCSHPVHLHPECIMEHFHMWRHGLIDADDKAHHRTEASGVACAKCCPAAGNDGDVRDGGVSDE